MIVENWGGSMAYFMAAGIALVAGLLALGLTSPRQGGGKSETLT